MTKSVVGIFDTPDQAQEAIADLVNVGIERPNISLIRRDQGKEHGTKVMPDIGMVSAGAADAAGSARVLDAETDWTEDDGVTDASGAATGAASGAVIGAGAALL